MKRILISLMALMLMLTLAVAAMAESTEVATAAESTDTATALQEAQEAYRAAKQTDSLTEYETELKSMVEAGTLTQEQADLLLNAAKESVALANGTCPNCGYQFQNGGRKGMNYGKGHSGKH